MAKQGSDWGGGTKGILLPRGYPHLRRTRSFLFLQVGAEAGHPPGLARGAGFARQNRPPPTGAADASCPGGALSREPAGALGCRRGGKAGQAHDPPVRRGGRRTRTDAVGSLPAPSILPTNLKLLCFPHSSAARVLALKRKMGALFLRLCARRLMTGLWGG